jgi:hypothetical protein
MEIRIGKDVDPRQSDQDENQFSFFKRYFEKQIGEKGREERKGVEKDDSVGQRDHPDGLEKAEEREGSEKTS